MRRIGLLQQQGALNLTKTVTAFSTAVVAGNDELLRVCSSTCLYRLAHVGKVWYMMHMFVRAGTCLHVLVHKPWFVNCRVHESVVTTIATCSQRILYAAGHHGQGCSIREARGRAQAGAAGPLGVGDAVDDHYEHRARDEAGIGERPELRAGEGAGEHTAAAGMF